MTLVEHSREPLRPVVSDDGALARCLEAIAQARGPVAFDVERAHGYRYFPRAYLLQLRRGDAGTWLIDPTRFDPAALGGLVAASGDAEWVIHAASQDLPSMFEVGIIPPRIFDTELAARLMGRPAVSLGALLSEELDVQLRKAHSAVNWSTRPLKESWLTYAALDVDFLIELRDALDDRLIAMQRRDWAEEEFRAELTAWAREPSQRHEPWRRLSRITTIRHRSGLALARALWLERDAIARRRDRPQTHILSDAAIVAAAAALGKADTFPVSALDGVAEFRQPPGVRYRVNWQHAIERFNATPPEQYPSRHSLRATGLPHPKSWQQANPEAARRWAKARPAVDELACEIGMQPSLLAPPGALQQVLWHHERPRRDHALQAGMRSWQAALLSGLFEELFG